MLSSIHWLMNHGDVPASATLTEAEFGWEVASTNGHPVDFPISNYWLSTPKR